MFASTIDQRLVKVAACAAGLAGLLLLTFAGSAQAVSVFRSGSPGSAGLPKTQGFRAAGGIPVVSFPGRCVYRSPAYAGAQEVTAYMRVWRYNRSYLKWDFVRQGISRDTLSPREVTCTGRYSPQITGMFEDLFTADVVVRWRRASDGAVIGSKTYSYDSMADYTCSGCTVFYSPDARRVGLFFG